MPMYQHSFRQQRQNKINSICAKMRAGKERKRLEQDCPEYPPDRPQQCMQIIIKNFECVEPQNITYILQTCSIRRDSYWIWKDKVRLPKPMGKAQFFRRMPINL
jgi:hypothetical protein